MVSLAAHPNVVSLLGVVAGGGSSSAGPEAQNNGAASSVGQWGLGLVLEWAPCGSLRDALDAGHFRRQRPGATVRPTPPAHRGRAPPAGSEGPFRVQLPSRGARGGGAPVDRGPFGSVLGPLASALAAEVAGGLAHCHTHGLAHLDVKSANIFLFPGPEAGQVTAKLGDFGAAVLVSPSRSGGAFGSRSDDSDSSESSSGLERAESVDSDDGEPPSPTPSPGGVLGNRGPLPAAVAGSRRRPTASEAWRHGGNGCSGARGAAAGGTLLYAAPEIVRRECRRGADVRPADVWALVRVLPTPRATR